MKLKPTKNIINRAKYKEIKKYDHRQMEQFLEVFYAGAYRDGAESQGSKDLEAFIQSLENGECKGIKEATARKIRQYAEENGLLINALGK